MFDHEVYKKIYGVKRYSIMDGLPPLFILKSWLGYNIVTTSPYFYDTHFGDHSTDRWGEYVQKCVEFSKKNRASYLLLKIVQPTSPSF